MANYNTNAQVTITVNGRQANQMMADLEKRSKSLTKAMEAANKAGDKEKLKTLRRELNQVNDAMAKLKGSTATAEEVLKRLDSATPKELNKALRELKRQMDSIERGSDLWKQKAEQIKKVKAEIATLNKELSNSRSRWDRFTEAVNNAGLAIMAGVAAASGMIAAGRKSVDEYASMEEQMANTRKYTGMTVDAVNQLNKAFTDMNTRTTREELNELAQEAGRLGKNTLESVQGYTEAAEIIKVALVDLGDGATQTIAKLTNIFGVEQLLGTKDAMLAVGSTVNVLSQNCTASKPYLVDFAQRMAGIGAQAGMTIPQILALGAVLDANGQKVEMSATAVQSILMKLANKNHEFAEIVGLDAQKLNETLKVSAKDGLLMFLEALQKLGQSTGMNNATMILAPAFKELGLDAARVSQVLGTLAMHLDEVKWQLGEADKAFREASSATNEYNIFNNTVQASIEKARNRVHELSVELGEKLYPIMRHIYTSSSVIIRGLNTTVDFIKQYWREIVTLVGAIGAYNAVMLVYNTRTAIAANTTALFHGGLNVLKKIVPALRMLFVPLVNSINYFTNGLQVNYTMQERWRKAMSTMSFGSWVGLITAAAGAIFLLTSRIRESRAAAEAARKEAEEYRRKIRNVDDTAANYAHNELSRLETLYQSTIDQSKATDERRKAAEKLQLLYPDYFKNMDTEVIMAGETKEAYDKLRDSILNVAKARAAADKITENSKELLNLQAEEQQLIAESDAAGANLKMAESKYDSSVAGVGSTPNFSAMRDFLKEREKYDDLLKKLAQNREKQSLINESNDFLRKNFDVATLAIGDNGSSVDVGRGTQMATEDNGQSKDRFAAEKEWREREEALARISYATGESDYVEYTERMKEIAVDYYDKILEHTDLSEAERLKAEADSYEAREALGKQVHAASIEEEAAYYNERLATIKQHYIDGLYSKETYDEAVQRAEMEHQRALVALYEEGSKEQVTASAKLQDMLLKQQQERQRKVEQEERRIQQMGSSAFGMSGNREDYEQSSKVLGEAYEMAKKLAEENGRDLLEVNKAYEIERLKLKKRTIGLTLEEEERLNDLLKKTEENSTADMCKKVSNKINEVASHMASVFSMLTNLVNAEMEIQTAAIEKRYDKEISLAEGNAYRVSQLEKQKEKEIAKAKNDASKKTYAMQVIQAIAQTASNAISAYGAMVGIPIVGPALAVAAASAAVAAGMLQVATLKKQQQAAAAQGYSSGGFTPKGRVDEPVGVVHAGEWVASQRLLANPQARTIIESLDYVQRRNTIGSITSADISGAVVSPPSARAFSSMPVPKIEVRPSGGGAGGGADMSASLRKLNERLEEPFVTVNTVEGEHGINQAIEKHNRLINRSKPRRNR